MSNQTFVANCTTAKVKEIKAWLNERCGEEGDDWQFDLFVIPFELFMVEFKSSRFQSLFELRFAGEVKFVNSVDAMRKVLYGSVNE